MGSEVLGHISKPHSVTNVKKERDSCVNTASALPLHPKIKSLIFFLILLQNILNAAPGARFNVCKAKAATVCRGDLTTPLTDAHVPRGI